MPMLLMLKVILTVIKGRIRQWEWDVPDVGGGRLSSKLLTGYTWFQEQRKTTVLGTEVRR